jgi:hypothetical protein
LTLPAKQTEIEIEQKQQAVKAKDSKSASKEGKLASKDLPTVAPSQLHEDVAWVRDARNKLLPMAIMTFHECAQNRSKYFNQQNQLVNPNGCRLFNIQQRTMLIPAELYPKSLLVSFQRQSSVK